MKKIYIIIFFMMFFNIFVLLFNNLGLFNYEGSGDEVNYNIDNTTGAISSESLVEDITGQENVLSWGGLGTVALIAGIVGGGLAGWITSSPYPIGVGLFLGTFANVYVNSRSVFEQFQVNPYLLLALGAGVIILMTITIIEYLTHGDT